LWCVRAGPGLQNIGFLAGKDDGYTSASAHSETRSDTRRMNVALTRARSSLFILGNVPTLERSDKNWRQITQDARSRRQMIDVSRGVSRTAWKWLIEVQATIGYFSSPSYRVPTTPITKSKAAPVARLPLKATEPRTPELIRPKDTMKPPIKRIASTGSPSNRGINSTATITASIISTEKPTPSPQTNGRSVSMPNGLPAPPRGSHSKKMVEYSPRPIPGASLFIPSKKV